MAGARISQEKSWVGWLGRVFLQKTVRSDGWGAHFLRKSLGRMVGARISREEGWVGWPGAHPSRNSLGRMAGARVSRERGWVGWMSGPLCTSGMGSRPLLHTPAFDPELRKKKKTFVLKNM